MLTIYDCTQLLSDKSFDHRMKLFSEVAKELAMEGRPVLWIMDSFSRLVSNALSVDALQGIEYSGTISMLFELNRVLIPVPVCSSATTAGDLANGKYTIEFDIRFHVV
jgi:hypothetical protein